MKPAPINADAIKEYLLPKENRDSSEPKGQLVINGERLVCRKLTKLERVGKIFGLGPAAAGQVLQFVNNKNIEVKEPKRLQYKLEKHTIRGFIKSFFYPKPPKPTEETKPSNSSNPQTAPVQSVPVSADASKSGQPYLKIGDKIDLNQSPMQKIHSPLGKQTCTVIAVKYDKDKKDMVYTLERLILSKDQTNWASFTERWEEPHKTLFPD